MSVRSFKRVGEPIIELDNVTYVYPGGVVALSNVSLTICKGERVAILGPNGAGKSTLLMHFNGLFLPSKGTVKVFGEAIHKDRLRGIRKRIGMVFQNPDDQLFSSTLWDDVAFGPLNMGLPLTEVEKNVKEAIAAVGLKGFESVFPHRLSEGQKKRAAIATVLAMKPEVWVLDEPTANLDPVGRRSVINFLLSLRRNATIIVATSSPSLARKLANRVILLSGGKIIADAPAIEVLSDRKLLRKAGLA
jgi:cobalt/nickel transport system ATP-binding protein